MSAILRRLSVGVICLCLLLAAACAPYDTVAVPPTAAGVELPVLSDIHLVVDALINGVPAKVLLDTGTVTTSLTSARAIEKFGLRGEGLNPFRGGPGAVGVCGGGVGSIDPALFVADTMDLSGVRIERLALTVLHEQSHDTFAESGVDVIASAPILVQMDWRVDDYGRRLTLFPAGSRTRPPHALDLEVAGPAAPFTPLKIGVMSLGVHLNNAPTEPWAFLLDTGGGLPMAVSDQVLSSFALDVEALPHVDQRIFGTGASCERVLFRVPSVDVGPFSYDNVLSLSLGEAGPLAILGWHFVANHESVYVCPSQEWIEFVAGSQTQTLFTEPLRTFGMSLRLNDESLYEVTFVRPGFSAEQAGVQIGDRIVSINGLPVGTVEGKSLLFGREVQRAGMAEFVIEDPSGASRTLILEAQDLL